MYTNQSFARTSLHVVSVRVCVLQSVAAASQEISRFQQALPVDPKGETRQVNQLIHITYVNQDFNFIIYIPSSLSAGHDFALNAFSDPLKRLLFQA